MKIQTEDALENWKRQLNIISFTTGEVASYTRKEIKKSQQWLKKIIDYCEQMEFIPVIVVPPMIRSLLKEISLRFRQLNFYDVLKEVVPQYIQILDHTEDSFFLQSGAVLLAWFFNSRYSKNLYKRCTS